MFKKAAVFTDIHLGLKGNSKVHNDDCERFVDWFIEQAKANNCETGIFCGDWHHNRNSLNLTTMDATIRCSHLSFRSEISNNSKQRVNHSHTYSRGIR